ncbi:SlyX family protein [Aliikangiella sp. IMCC44359]|uniref:SlyX family protein n=1 Tax=Aliikangiella sp. IMCC44359 TaxID=3459125 RepID=UPI00403AF4F2
MGSTNQLQERIDDLEMKVTFQEELIEQLNQSIIQQQEDIRLLTRLIEKTNAKLQDIQQPNVIDAQMETPPPHY